MNSDGQGRVQPHPPQVAVCASVDHKLAFLPGLQVTVGRASLQGSGPPLCRFVVDVPLPGVVVVVHRLGVKVQEVIAYCLCIVKDDQMFLFTKSYFL